MERVAFRGISREYLPLPGETLAEVLEDRGMSQEELAARICCSNDIVSEVLNGSGAISAEMANGLEDALGVEAQFWLNPQAAYNEATVRLNEEEQAAGHEKEAASGPVVQ